MMPRAWNGAARNGYPGSFSLIHRPSGSRTHWATPGTPPPGPAARKLSPPSERAICADSAWYWALDRVRKCPCVMATIEPR